MLSFMTVSCDDFLSEDPDNRVYLESPEYIAYLLATAYPEADIAFAEAMSDCAGDRGLDAILDDKALEQSYLWKNVVETYQGTPSYYWFQAYAAISGRDYVIPDDVKKVSVPILSHRIITRSQNTIRLTDTNEQIIEYIIDTVRAPID